MVGLDFSTLFKAYNKMGYKFYDSGRFNVNLFGIRDSEKTDDGFNGILGVAYIDSFGRPVVIAVNGTTKPGAYWLGEKHIGNKNGTFVLKEGYYKSCFKMGLHNGKYECLVQAKSDVFEGYRDRNKNGVIDYEGKLYKDVTGLNFHTTSFINDKEKVGAYSAGCQVVQDDKDHLTIMPIVKKSIEIYGTGISYALFNKKDFF
jgi:hypothetical protein